MKINIPRLFVMTRTAHGGQQIHTPFLFVAENVDALDAKNIVQKLVPVGNLSEDYEMPLERIFPAVRDYFIKRLDEGDTLFFVKEHLHYLNHVLKYGTKENKEEMLLLKSLSTVKDEVEYAVHQLVGEALKKRVGFENWTQEGYPMRCNIPKGKKTVQRRIFTWDDFQDIVKILRKGNGITGEPYFDFSNKVAYRLSGEKLYEKKGMKEILAHEFYIIDTAPDAADGERRYMAAPKMFIQKAITTKYPNHAMKFATEDEALQMALKSVDTFENGGFEIRFVKSSRIPHVLLRSKCKNKSYFL